MKIVTGLLKGARLQGPGKKDTFRPTENRTREALFNILDSRGLYGSFLDMFAGSGAVGIEAFSRGYEPVTLVESNKEHAAIIRGNLQSITTKFNLKREPAKLVQWRARDFLKRNTETFDVVFVDPPYKMVKNTLIKEVLDSAPVTDSGIVIFEHSNKTRILNEHGNWKMVHQAEYGHCKLSFFSVKGSENW